MARTIREWAESGIGSEVRALYAASPGRRSGHDDGLDPGRSGEDQGDEGEGHRKIEQDDDEPEME